jgi:hypothetical protein
MAAQNPLPAVMLVAAALGLGAIGGWTVAREGDTAAPGMLRRVSIDPVGTTRDERPPAVQIPTPSLLRIALPHDFAERVGQMAATAVEFCGKATPPVPEPGDPPAETLAECVQANVAESLRFVLSFVEINQP